MTYNVAFWNLHERSVDRADSTYVVNGRPITFFHFSGFDPGNPKLLSKHENRTLVRPESGLADLINWYAQLQMQNGFEATRRLTYSYATFSNGVPIEPCFRQKYRLLDTHTRNRFGDPFEATAANSFFKWIVQEDAKTES